MYIRFDDLDLLDFFESEPISIGEPEGGVFLYNVRDNTEHSMTLVIDTYDNEIDVSVGYMENTVFSEKFKNVVAINQSGGCLLVEMESKRRIVLKRKPCMGVTIENI